MLCTKAIPQCLGTNKNVVGEIRMHISPMIRAHLLAVRKTGSFIAVPCRRLPALLGCGTSDILVCFNEDQKGYPNPKGIE